ncbi:hypothetical protein NLG97_g9671 [Lecanicillium saksenae]|uniref:Uncharacterized protein n=1 Tax=Lecanicillium saksenae TaxID=468837 RepID=A0ACC1QH18_9HYPO|nr:hypothetical protein NLG97_g9671 [Lecanicillium saksenae]
MNAIAILVISWVLGAFARNSHNIPGFQYIGCSSIDLSCFGDPVVFPDGCVTPEACQKACQGSLFAALLNEECRCGNDSSAITPKDDSLCDHTCQNNPLLGCCGNSCPQDNPGIANIYGKEPPLEKYTAPNAATTDASASLSSSAPVNSQLVTPAGPAPEPQRQSSALAVSQSGTTQAGEPCPTAQPSQYQTADGQAPEPKAYETSTADAVQATTSDCTTSAPAIIQYETTMATKAAPTNRPYGESPIPSQVPGSDSAPVCLPSFSSIGGLALIAVMIIRQADKNKTYLVWLHKYIFPFKVCEMQSGISASQELHEQFSSLLSSSSTFALLVGIEKESLVPIASVPSASSFSSDLNSLQSHIKPNAALYAIIRRYDAAPKLAAVTYVPDAAPVRQKMLFASTRLTLTRELGLEHFRESLFFTLPDEFTEAGFKKADAHAKLEAPLTEEERTLGEVKRAEQEAGAGTGTREIHLSKSLAMPVSEDAIAALKDMQGSRAVTMLKINPATEAVELVPESPNPNSISELSQAISSTEPRFTFYRYKHTHNGEEQSPLLFFYTCPASAGAKSIKNRMMYPLMKRAVLTIADQTAGLTIEKKFEVEETSEVTEQLVLDDLHPKPAARQGFSRPKRPGR